MSYSCGLLLSACVYSLSLSLLRLRNYWVIYIIRESKASRNVHVLCKLRSCINDAVSMFLFSFQTCSLHACAPLLRIHQLFQKNPCHNVSNGGSHAWTLRPTNKVSLCSYLYNVICMYVTWPLSGTKVPCWTLHFPRHKAFIHVNFSFSSSKVQDLYCMWCPLCTSRGNSCVHQQLWFKVLYMYTTLIYLEVTAH